jgi:hypothetical protein
MGEQMDVRLSRGNLLGVLWRPAGVIYLCFCLAGLAAGLWHDRIVPHFGHAGDTTLPTLQTLAVAQVFFFLLVYPIILLKRRQEEENNCGLKVTTSALRTSHFELLLELLGMFIVTMPLYIIVVWLGDAAGKDVLRAILTVAAVCPLGVLAGRLLARPAWRGGVMLGLLVIVLGLPGAWYICADFLYVSCDRLLDLSPVMLAWTSAGAQQTNWLPQPTWAWLTWPILAAIGGACLWALTSRNIESNRS